MLLERVKKSIPPALSVAINQNVTNLKQQGRDIICLSLGEAFFDLPRLEFDPQDIALGYHYSDSQGVPALRAKIADYYRHAYHASVSAHNILISSGSKILLYMSMQALLQPGEEVLIPEPAWLSYQHQAHLVGATVRFIPFNVPIEACEAYFTDKTRLFILNNPNNPAGCLYSRKRLDYLYQCCHERGVYLLIDEAYSDFVKPREFYSMAALVPSFDKLIVVNSLSKNMGISGWRIGYAMAAPDLVQALLILNQHLITCAPTLLQLHLARHFDTYLKATLPQIQALIIKRAQIAIYLDKLGLNYLAGNSTFYFFISVGNYKGAVSDLAEYLLFNKGIAVVPGCAYGQSTDKFIRLSIATESEARIYRALDIIKEMLISPPMKVDRAYRQLDRIDSH